MAASGSFSRDPVFCFSCREILAEVIVSKSQNIQILIAGDPSIFRDGLRKQLAKGRFRVVGSATNGKETLNLVRQLRPDVHTILLTAHGRDMVLSDLLATLRGSAMPAPGTSRTFGLTRREFEVIAAVADGQVNKEIAKTLQMAECTVKHHLTRIFDKLGVSNRVELAIFAIHHHLEQRS